MKVNILGTTYEVVEKSIKEDTRLIDMDGYTDDSTKCIVVNKMEPEFKDISSKDNLKVYQQQVFRHEIIHAFLFESGLGSECEWATEEMIDWLAAQFPKISQAVEAISKGISDEAEDKIVPDGFGGFVNLKGGMNNDQRRT